MKDFLSGVPVSEYAKAYRSGGTLSDNAEPHCGKRYLLKVDFKDFFGSISENMVYSSAFGEKYFHKDVGEKLAKLCCKEGKLPQGAPTSPALSNIIMKKFDDTLGEWCGKIKLVYTRYCDDITISGNVKLYHAYEKVKNLAEENGFCLNEEKTRFITNANRQAVTGLTVNEKVSVSLAYKRELRQEVYYALKYGLEDALLYTHKKEYISGGNADVEKYYNHLIGKINFVLQIEPDNKWFKEALIKLKKIKKQ